MSDFDEEELSHQNDEFSIYGNSYTDWEKEAVFHKFCETMVGDEISVYQHLEHLQGKFIPQLIQQVRTCPWSRLAGPPFERFFQAPRFLLECVDGVSLEEVGKMLRFFWQEVYEEAARTANALEYYGFDHKSLSPRNPMVKHERAANGRPRVVLIDLHMHGKWSEEDGYFKYDIRYVDNNDECLRCRSECSGDWSNGQEDFHCFSALFVDQIYAGRLAERDLFGYPTILQREYEETSSRNTLEYRQEDVVSQFSDAFDRYCQRPNGPPLTLVETLGDTFLADVLHSVAKDPSASGKAGSGPMDADAGSSSSSYYSRAQSTASTDSSADGCFSITSSAASSAASLSLLESLTTTKARVQIFIPKKAKDQVIEVEENLG